VDVKIGGSLNVLVERIRNILVGCEEWGSSGVIFHIVIVIDVNFTKRQIVKVNKCHQNQSKLTLDLHKVVKGGPIDSFFTFQS
jgi:hypothetical protein